MKIFQRNRFFLDIKQIRDRKWKIVAVRPKNGDKKVATFIMEGTKRKLSPFVFVTRWQISTADLLPTETCFAFPQQRKLYFSNWDNLYFFGAAEFYFFASAVVFLQRNNQISPITQSAQRGALETFILCTLQFSSVGRLSTRAMLE